MKPDQVQPWPWHQRGQPLRELQRAHEEFVLHPDTRLLHVPRAAAAAGDGEAPAAGTAVVPTPER